MIPKVIHYCWFGGSALPDTAKKCIDSWKKYCPDYEIKEWNETNIDISSVDYMKEAYESKAWGFVPDVARLQIIYENGGIYLDTDVEMIKPFDHLLQHMAFMGIEDNRLVALGLGFGAEKGNALIGELLNDYSNRHYKNDDGTFNRDPAPNIQTAFLKSKGFQPQKEIQTFLGATIYPSEYFCPRSAYTGVMRITGNTYSIHHYDGSWHTENEEEMTKARYETFSKWGGIAGIVWPFVHIKTKMKQVGVYQTILIALRTINKKIGS